MSTQLNKELKRKPEILPASFYVLLGFSDQTQFCEKMEIIQSELLVES